MNRIANAFNNKKAFVGFLTGGDPSINKTEEFILEMVKGGADLIEIGIPFSDPIAEGPVIQRANIRSLLNNTNIDDLFKLVQSVRKKTNVPIVFLSYLNPIFKYGYENFFKKCKFSGVDGIIVPDLPFGQIDDVYSEAKKENITIVSLIAPTSKDRIQAIASKANGFIYLVSSLGVTGIRSEIQSDLPTIINTIKDTTNTPVAVGFGINTTQQAKEISSIADGIIVGSAIVKIIEKHGDLSGKHIYDYVHSMKNAMVD